MGLSPQVSGPKLKIFRCKRCKKRHNNPLTHVCKVRFNEAGRRKIQARQGRS